MPLFGADAGWGCGVVVESLVGGEAPGEAFEGTFVDEAADEFICLAVDAFHGGDWGVGVVKAAADFVLRRPVVGGAEVEVADVVAAIFELDDGEVFLDLAAEGVEAVAVVACVLQLPVVIE